MSSHKVTSTEPGFRPEQPAPDPQELSKADRSKIVDWLNTRQKFGDCPVCGTNHWTVGGHLLHGQALGANGGIIIGGSNYPMAFVVCDNCAYVRQFMAVPMGLDFLKKEAGDV